MNLPTNNGAGASDAGNGGAALRIVGKGADEEARRKGIDQAANGNGASVVAIAGTLKHHMNVQHNLCSALEALADKLPADVRNDDCLALARSVYPIVHRSHVFEEQTLFPFLKAQCADVPDLGDTLDRLHGEHWEDEAFAEEVHHELVAFAADRSQINVEKLSYMLRGFFVGLRRHLAFEREHLLPMVEALEDGR
ncbi:MAG: hemerythrin domain-containing protein [Roseitalea sp.]|jgi:hemerythrin-like domain-containing protein|uniref:Hemerythrin domain-containing protein n=1 Tax=Oceaniradius stylonematis TaxID=2184161 RepID=A0A3A8A877_9HYPH|nr:hemerythrin domain-containing protein [Oceaniradius stylonematis]MBO6551266.1 hemerythrin domain-containing protein [Roseitalea sp.]MBO6952354.1 hemerythrin domain-containing protein [Rhizobiaceae bacterium]RNC90634.1 MAG: hemerythrin domain-containing protein [Oricola sp.]MBO6591800.1 hemerythrin domain-containing protein [Roseitalea sp.]MBO6598055.1 hemerythrin domain-containing protein [Roseitalea sp.]